MVRIPRQTLHLRRATSSFSVLSYHKEGNGNFVSSMDSYRRPSGVRDGERPYLQEYVIMIKSQTETFKVVNCKLTSMTYFGENLPDFLLWWLRKPILFETWNWCNSISYKNTQSIILPHVRSLIQALKANAGIDSWNRLRQSPVQFLSLPLVFNICSNYIYLKYSALHKIKKYNLIHIAI
jgi:hypothetical protein